MPTFTPLSFRRGVLEGGMGVRFPAGLKTLGVVGLLKGACFGMPLSGAAEKSQWSVAMTSRDGPGQGCPRGGWWGTACLSPLVCSTLFQHEQRLCRQRALEEGDACLLASPTGTPQQAEPRSHGFPASL